MINDLYTRGGEYLLEGVDYVGSYHIHQNGIVMTDGVFSNKSRKLSVIYEYNWDLPYNLNPSLTYNLRVSSISKKHLFDDSEAIRIRDSLLPQKSDDVVIRRGSPRYSYWYQIPPPTGVETSILIVFPSNILNVGDEVGFFDLNGRRNSGDCSDDRGEILVGSATYTGGVVLQVQCIGSIDNCGSGGTQQSGYVPNENSLIVMRVYDTALQKEFNTSWNCQSPIGDDTNTYWSYFSENSITLSDLSRGSEYIAGTRATGYIRVDDSFLNSPGATLSVSNPNGATIGLQGSHRIRAKVGGSVDTVTINRFALENGYNSYSGLIDLVSTGNYYYYDEDLGWQSGSGTYRKIYFVTLSTGVLSGEQISIGGTNVQFSTSSAFNGTLISVKADDLAIDNIANRTTLAYRIQVQLSTYGPDTATYSIDSGDSTKINIEYNTPGVIGNTFSINNTSLQYSQIYRSNNTLTGGVGGVDYSQPWEYILGFQNLVNGAEWNAQTGLVIPWIFGGLNPITGNDANPISGGDLELHLLITSPDGTVLSTIQIEEGGLSNEYTVFSSSDFPLGNPPAEYFGEWNVEIKLYLNSYESETNGLNWYFDANGYVLNEDYNSYAYGGIPASHLYVGSSVTLSCVEIFYPSVEVVSINGNSPNSFIFDNLGTIPNMNVNISCSNFSFGGNYTFILEIENKDNGTPYHIYTWNPIITGQNITIDFFEDSSFDILNSIGSTSIYGDYYFRVKLIDNGSPVFNEYGEQVLSEFIVELMEDVATTFPAISSPLPSIVTYDTSISIPFNISNFTPGVDGYVYWRLRGWSVSHAIGPDSYLSDWVRIDTSDIVNIDFSSGAIESLTGESISVYVGTNDVDSRIDLALLTNTFPTVHPTQSTFYPTSGVSNINIPLSYISAGLEIVSVTTIVESISSVLNNQGIDKIHVINDTSFDLNNSFNNFVLNDNGTMEYRISKYGSIDGYAQSQTSWINSISEVISVDTTAHGLPNSGIGLFKVEVRLLDTDSNVLFVTYIKILTVIWDVSLHIIEPIDQSLSVAPYSVTLDWASKVSISVNSNDWVQKGDLYDFPSTYTVYKDGEKITGHRNNINYNINSSSLIDGFVDWEYQFSAELQESNTSFENLYWMDWFQGGSSYNFNLSSDKFHLTEPISITMNPQVILFNMVNPVEGGLVNNDRARLSVEVSGFIVGESQESGADGRIRYRNNNYNIVNNIIEGGGFEGNVNGDLLENGDIEGYSMLNSPVGDTAWITDANRYSGGYSLNCMFIGGNGLVSSGDNIFSVSNGSRYRISARVFVVTGIVGMYSDSEFGGSNLENFSISSTQNSQWELLEVEVDSISTGSGQRIIVVGTTSFANFYIDDIKVSEITLIQGNWQYSDATSDILMTGLSEGINTIDIGLVDFSNNPISDGSSFIESSTSYTVAYPTVSIQSPIDGSVISTGYNFDLILSTTNSLPEDLFEIYIDGVMIAVYGSEVISLENIYFGEHNLKVVMANNYQEYFPNQDSSDEIDFTVSQLSYEGYVGLFYVSPSPTINLHLGNIFTSIESISTLSYYDEIITLIQGTLFSENPQFIAPISVDNISVENLNSLQEIETRCIQGVIWGDEYIATEYDLESRRWHIALAPFQGIVYSAVIGTNNIILNEIDDSFFGKICPNMQKIIVSGYYKADGENQPGNSYIHFESMIVGYNSSSSGVFIVVEDVILQDMSGVSFSIEYVVENDDLASEYFIDSAGNKNLIIENTQDSIIVEVPLGSDIMLSGRWGVIKAVDDS